MLCVIICVLGYNHSLWVESLVIKLTLLAKHETFKREGPDGRVGIEGIEGVFEGNIGTLASLFQFLAVSM